MSPVKYNCLKLRFLKQRLLFSFFNSTKLSFNRLSYFKSLNVRFKSRFKRAWFSKRILHKRFVSKTLLMSLKKKKSKKLSRLILKKTYTGKRRLISSVYRIRGYTKRRVPKSKFRHKKKLIKRRVHFHRGRQSLFQRRTYNKKKVRCFRKKVKRTKKFLVFKRYNRFFYNLSKKKGKLYLTNYKSYAQNVLNKYFWFYHFSKLNKLGRYVKLSSQYRKRIKLLFFMKDKLRFVHSFNSLIYAKRMFVKFNLLSLRRKNFVNLKRKQIRVLHTVSKNNIYNKRLKDKILTYTFPFYVKRVSFIVNSRRKKKKVIDYFNKERDYLSSFDSLNPIVNRKLSLRNKRLIGSHSVKASINIFSKLNTISIRPYYNINLFKFRYSSFFLGLKNNKIKSLREKAKLNYNLITKYKKSLPREITSKIFFGEFIYLIRTKKKKNL